MFWFVLSVLLLIAAVVVFVVMVRQGTGGLVAKLASGGMAALGLAMLPLQLF